MEKEILSKETIEDIDLVFYRLMYPDLEDAGIISDDDLYHHYDNHGRAELRIRNLSDWLDRHELPQDLLGNLEDCLKEFQRAFGQDSSFSLGKFLNSLIHADSPSYKFFKDDYLSSNIYLEVAVVHLQAGNQQEASLYLVKALKCFPNNGRALELLGNLKNESGNYEDALRLYNLALQLSGPNKWLLLNIVKAHLALGELDLAFNGIHRCFQSYPQFTIANDLLDDLAEALWLKTDSEAQLDAVLSEREDLISRIQKYSELLYRSYLLSFGVEKPLPFLGDINLNQIFTLTN